MLHSTLLVETSPNMPNFAKLTTTHYLKNDCEMNVVIFCTPHHLKNEFLLFIFSNLDSFKIFIGTLFLGKNWNKTYSSLFCDQQ